MRKKLLSVLALSMFGFVGFGQEVFWGSSEIETNNNDQIEGLYINFTDASITDEGLKYNGLTTSIEVNEDEEVLEVITNASADTINWWDRGNLQFFTSNEAGDGYLSFDIDGLIGRFLIETPKEIGYWFKLDYEIWSQETAALALEGGDTISTVNEPVMIDFNFAQIARDKGIDFSSTDYSMLYLWIWTTDHTSDTVKLHGISAGTLIDRIVDPNAPTAIAEVMEDVNILSGNIAKIEVLNVLGQIEKVVYSAEEIETSGELIIVKVTYTDGSVATGKVVK